MSGTEATQPVNTQALLDALAAKDKAISEMRAELERLRRRIAEVDGAPSPREGQAIMAEAAAIDRVTAAEAQLERAEALAGCAAKACRLTPAALAQLASDAESFLARLDALSQDEPADLGVGG